MQLGRTDAPTKPPSPPSPPRPFETRPCPSNSMRCGLHTNNALHGRPALALARRQWHTQRRAIARRQRIRTSPSPRRSRLRLKLKCHPRAGSVLPTRPLAASSRLGPQRSKVKGQRDGRERAGGLPGEVDPRLQLQGPSRTVAIGRGGCCRRDKRTE